MENDEFQGQGHTDRFEFEVGQEPDKRVYQVYRGGKAAMKCLDEGAQIGQYGIPKFGIVDTGYMSYIWSTEGPLSKDSKESKSEYQAARDYLELCQKTALALLGEKELWGIHIHDIIEYYHAVKSQSDNLLSRTTDFHREFESYRLPEISDEDKEKMHQIAMQALENALKRIS